MRDETDPNGARPGLHARRRPGAMIPRSITARLIFSYCLLLALLGGAFLLFTVLSFQQFTHETLPANLATRTKELWNTARGQLSHRGRVVDVIDRRFAAESQNRFIRISVDGREIYRSSDPVDREFSAAAVPASDARNSTHEKVIGDLLLYTRSFR